MNKTAIDILFNTNSVSKIGNWQEDSRYKDAIEEIEPIFETLIEVESKREELYINLEKDDEILLELEEVLLGTSQLEINCTKEYWRKQLEHTVLTHKEPRGSSLEASD